MLSCGMRGPASSGDRIILLMLVVLARRAYAQDLQNEKAAGPSSPNPAVPSEVEPLTAVPPALTPSSVSTQPDVPASSQAQSSLSNTQAPEWKSSSDATQGIPHGFYGGAILETMKDFGFEAQHVHFQKSGYTWAIGGFLGYEVLTRREGPRAGAGGGIAMYKPMNLGTIAGDSSDKAGGTSIFLYTFNLMVYIMPFESWDVAFHGMFNLGGARAKYQLGSDTGSKTTTNILNEVGFGVRLPIIKHIGILVESRWRLQKVSESCSGPSAGVIRCSGDTKSSYAPAFAFSLFFN
jgi:hypothetical protein